MYQSARKSEGIMALVISLLVAVGTKAQPPETIRITNDVQAKKLTFGNAKMKAILDYDRQADISFLDINGQTVISKQKGIFSGITTKAAVYSSLRLSKSPFVRVAGDTITVSGIRYGDSSVSISERWTFTIRDSAIKLGIERTLSKTIEAEEVASPAIVFDRISDWDGAFQDYGGLAWFYLFKKRSDTYGTHSRTARFWNSKTGNGLSVAVEAPGKNVVMAYSRTSDDRLAFTTTISPDEIRLRLDSGTYRRRFLSDTTTKVWAPVTMNAGTAKEVLVLSYFDFNEDYGRGELVGIDGVQVSDVLNTIARIGVIDKAHFGGNSWHTPYGPICLHEQYIAQMGLAIDDPAYLKGYQQCLDFYRDNAIKPDGRVWSRWAYTNEDAMPGEFTAKGFYEAQWGCLLDANTDLVTNVSELYDQTGDKAWVRTHQRSCEKALDWLLKRDHDHNGLVEMMTDSTQQKRSSDWIDIIWASYENAFVNAKLYHALILWANIEKQLGNSAKAAYYDAFAQKLKINFNKPTAEGGFWDQENGCYIHWRDKNGSIHGRNMVVPVNFMAIGYGICDDQARIKNILDNIETQMQKEHLFFWPLCMTTYAKGEGSDWQFPFPNYENGDIFLSWGALGIKVYAAYKPGLALKYVKNVLAQYAKDGLAYQRYGRVKQNGLGDDILAGNCLSVVGLYQAIYGINPLYNRFYLDPHLTNDLAGTKIRYNYRGQRLNIGLAMKCYSVSNGQFRITDSSDFGVFFSGSKLSYFNRASENTSLEISTENRLNIGVKYWGRDSCSWTQSAENTAREKVHYKINHLKPNSLYRILIDQVVQKIASDAHGSLIFDYSTSKNRGEIAIEITTTDRSPIPEPYPYISGGGCTGPKVPLSPDPLVTYRWRNPTANDDLEIYLLKPVTISTDAPASFTNLVSLKGGSPNVTVRGTGSIRLDFGTESAAWLEFDSPDLADSVEMSISEYNEPARASIVPGRLTKTLCPKRHGNTYRLELNKELYEGVRFGWIHVRSFSKVWHITGARLVCQIRPTNYNGSFSCSDTQLTRIWYAGGYTVKLNLLKDYFGAILMYRGDRFSWTGDAHPAQAASMVAFGNYDMVKKNIGFTAGESNGIRSYALYWVLSLIDYFNYTGDTATLKTYAANAMGKLEDAYAVYGEEPNLEYYGWDERLGAGFEHPNIPEPQRAYKMLSIRAWKMFGDAMAMIGRTDLQSKYNRYANEKIKEWRSKAGWYTDVGLHAGADAVNTGLLTSAEKNAIYAHSFSNRVDRISFSPFNQYFVIQALALMGRYDVALSSIRDLWGGQLNYGGTTFFEDYRPSWNSVIGKNDPVPNNQCGFTSLCHPWGAGVTKWLSEEVLGIKPASPGFGTYAILPHLGRTLTHVAGNTPTPKGRLSASFNVSTGISSVISPAGTIGRIGIPKVDKNIVRITVNGVVAWDGAFHTVAGIAGASQDSLFVYFTGVQPGSYAFVTSYTGITPHYKQEAKQYPACCLGLDTMTGGNWGGVYGKDGYALCNYNGNGKDKLSLPAYVSSIEYYRVKGNDKPLDTVWESATDDRRALASDAADSGRRTAACLYAMDPDQIGYTFTVAVRVKGTHKYRVSLYFLDWDKQGRKIAVEMFDGKTLNLVAPVKIVKDCVGGAYLTYVYDRSAKFRIDLVRGTNPVLSGIFFDPPPGPHQAL